jgi:adenylate cyclase class IV
MIEVEKKFQPTEEQIASLLKDCEFVGEVINHDILYDYPDYRLISKSIRLRKRNGNFELKTSSDTDESTQAASLEIEDQEEIKKYFGIISSVEEFVNKNMIEGINMKTTRQKYKKGNFHIDVDSIDFGYKCVEIEVMVKESGEIEQAYKDIIELAKSYHFDTKDIPPKKKEYFRVVKPEVFKLLYPQG